MDVNTVMKITKGVGYALAAAVGFLSSKKTIDNVVTVGFELGGTYLKNVKYPQLNK